jgi:hypothetical protein
MWKTDFTLKVAFTLVGVALISTIKAIAQAPADPMVRLGPDVWFIIAGGLVTVGINLEQLRRVRADMREVKSTNEKAQTRVDERHEENLKRFDEAQREHTKTFQIVDRRLGRVEDTLDFLRKQAH